MLKDYLHDYRTDTLNKLTSSSDQVELYRLQGMLRVIEDILQLRGEVVKYVKGLADGTMKKIEAGGINAVPKR